MTNLTLEQIDAIASSVLIHAIEPNVELNSGQYQAISNAIGEVLQEMDLNKM